jgi:hypothetical protein
MSYLRYLFLFVGGLLSYICHLCLFVGGFLSYLRYLCLFAHSGVQHILCFGLIRLVYPMLTVSLPSN